MAEQLRPQPPKQSKPSKKGKLIFACCVVALSGAAAWFGIAYWQVRAEADRLKNNPSEVVKREANRLVALIGRHMDLPSETPTIATVEDKQKLRDQAFFKRAQNGDKVLMYTKGKLAILYRPSADRIIEVAYLNIKSQSTR